MKGEAAHEKAGTAWGKNQKEAGKNCNGRVERPTTAKGDDDDDEEEEEKKKGRSNLRCIAMHYLGAVKVLSSRARPRQNVILSSSGGKSKAHCCE